MNEWMHTLKFTCVHPNICYLTVVSLLLLEIITESSKIILLSHIAEVHRETWPLAVPTGCILQPVQASINVVGPRCAGPSRDGTISEDTIRASLISAVSDKLRWRMKEEMDRAQAELNALKRTEEDLKKGHQKLEEMVTRLDQEVVS